MADDAVSSTLNSLPDLYVDLLWNLETSGRIMLIEFPRLASAAADPELATALRDCLGMASHHTDALATLLSHFSQPARAHPADLEALLGSAARRFEDLPAGNVRDLALCVVARTAVHLAIPASDLAMSLAVTVGYEEHIDRLRRLRHDIAASDARLELIARTRVAAHLPIGMPALESTAADS